MRNYLSTTKFLGAICALIFTFSFYNIDAQTCASNYNDPWKWQSQSNWFTGDGVFINFPGGTGAPAFTYKTTVADTNRGYEGTAAISDNNGNLLAYSNGRMIWRADGTLIASNMLAGNEAGSVGERSSAVQGIVAVRHPNTPQQIHLFTSDDALTGTDVGVNYSVLDLNTYTMTAPVRLRDDAGNFYRSTEQIDATFHANGNDIWVVVRQSGNNTLGNFRNFYSYSITCNGLDTVPVKSDQIAPPIDGTWNINYERGAMKISWDGTKAATCNHIGGWDDYDDAVVVYDFDNATGLLSNAKASAAVWGGFSWTGTSYQNQYDLEWAPDSRGLYVATASGTNRLIWMDASQATAAAIYATIKVVTTNISTACDIKLGGDDKLYQATFGNTLRQFDFGSVANLNSGTGVTVNTIATTQSTSRGLSNMFIPPIDYLDLSANGTNMACTDPPVNLSVAWLCSGNNAENTSVAGWSADCGACITDANNGVFDPSIAGAGTHRVYYTHGTSCSVIDSLDITVTCGACLDTSLANIPDQCVSATGTFDLNAFKVTAAAGTWTIVSAPGGSTASITGGNIFNINNTVTGSYTVEFDVTANGPGCGANPQRTFNINQPNVSLTLGQTQACESAAAFALTGGSPAGGTYSGTGVTHPNFDPSTAGNGTHTIKYVYTDGQGCSDSATATLTVDTVPTVAITPFGPLCDNVSAVTMSATPNNSGTWTINGNGATNSFDPNAIGAGSHNVKYVFTDGNGCTDSSTVAVTVNASPTVNLASASFCQGDSAQLDAGNAGSTFLWKPSGETSQTVWVTTAGPHEVVVTNGNGCKDSASVTMTVDTVPTVAITTFGPLCESASAVTMNATPNNSGTWTINGNAATNNFDPSTLGNGNHTIKYVFTDGNNCTDSNTINVQVDTVPTVAITAFGPLCDNEGAVTMNATPNNSGTWIINGNGATNSFDPNTIGAGSHTVKYIFTDGNNCTDSNTVNVTVNARPNVSLASASFCQGDSAQLDAGNAGSTFLWKPSGETSQTVWVKTAGPHEVVVTTGAGCRDSASVTMTVDTIPVVAITAFGPLCDNESAVNMNATPNNSGTWTINGNGATNSFDPNALGAGTHNVKYVFTDGNTCTDSNTVSITVNAAPTAAINPSNSVWCTNDSLTLTGAPASGVNYAWSQSGLNSTNQIVKVAGTGPFRLTVTDQVNGCKDSTESNFTAQLPDPNLGADQEVCAGLSLTLDPQVSNIANYQWSDGSNGSTLNITVGFGTYWVIVTDNQNCVDTDSIVISPATPFTVDLGNNDSICDGESSTINVTTSAPVSNPTYTWTPNIGNSASEAATTQDVYWVVVADDKNCRDSDSVYIHVRPNPTVDLGPDTTFCSLGKEQFTVYMSVNGNAGYHQEGTYTWSPISSSVDSVTITFAPTLVIGSYEDEHGCSGTDSVSLTEQCDPLVMTVPNVFVPGGNNNPFFNPIGVNDTNYINYVNNTIASDFVIYNRWGLRVFQSNDILPKWDGYYENRPVSSGTYFYIWTYKDSALNEYKINGFVQVIQQNDR